MNSWRQGRRGGARPTGDRLQLRRPAWGAARAALRDEHGAATAEYAIITVAAVGIAGLLVVVLRSEEVRALLVGLVQGALTVGG